MSDNIHTINARDLKYHNGSVDTLYDTYRPDYAMDCKGMHSIERLASDIVNRQAVFAINATYVNMQGFKVITKDYPKNPRPETVVRTVKRGLYQQEWETLQQMLTQQ